jgi:predicted secreted Zn-dependent protease
MRLTTLFPAACFAVLCQHAIAAPSINIQTRFYQISGNDPESVRQEVQIKGPRGRDGTGYHASTQWNLKWGYRWIESASRCRISSVEVDIDVTYQLPELVNRSQLPESFLQRWDRYYQALYRHEQQHKDYGVKAAQELEQTLLDTSLRPCSSLESDLTARAQAVLDKYQQLEHQYDVETDHGIKEGIVLP